MGLYFNGITFLLMVITAYHTTIEPLTGIILPVYLFTIISFMAVAMWLEYRYIMPSSFRFNFDQNLTHSRIFGNWVDSISTRLDIIIDQHDDREAPRFRYHRRKYASKVVI